MFPKQLAMETHQEAVCLGTAKWKSLIRSCRQYNENVETNLLQKIDEWEAGVQDQAICRQPKVISIGVLTNSGCKSH